MDAVATEEVEGVIREQAMIEAIILEEAIVEATEADQEGMRLTSLLG